MAYKTTAICDKCKSEVTVNTNHFNEYQHGYRTVKLEISQYSIHTYLFCGQCCKSLGLNNETKSVESAKTVADTLIDCIAEIVAEQVAERTDWYGQTRATKLPWKETRGIRFLAIS